uniref:protein CHLOROPLAST IMPORT APPARATUS 2 isoform X2 n=1 Tax=Erigeron canadensis TaxID=72917 RepID=UPI001CB8ABB1|nr:protein CHLOROPLAST IMPORT APPARATUS 2 isoform X2 [Erigeron canadensis]
MKMGQNSLLKSPKKEEHLVPDSEVDDFFESNLSSLSDFKSIWGIKDEGCLGEGVMSSNTTYDEISRDHLIEWDDCFSMNDEDQNSGVLNEDNLERREENNIANMIGNIKDELCGVWQEAGDEDQEDDNENKTCLNLNLNYQEVMDAWSDRGPCWTNDLAHSTPNNGYMGEVPVMKESSARREASVLRYKKKRKNRLFTRKIRYQVRKLNADIRPRYKGRFVRRES